MNRNILCLCIGATISASLPLCAQAGAAGKATEQDKTVQISSGTVNKDYRIEVEKDNEGRPLRIRLRSPENKVIKNFSPERVKVSENLNYLIYESTSHVTEDANSGGGYIEKEKVLYNAKGEKKWTKTYRSYPVAFDEELGDPSFGEDGISVNGERTYFNFRDEQGKYCVVVYDTEGKELAKGCAENGLNEIQISPDGKLVGAWTPLGGIKYLFFLNVDTGATKMVKADIAGSSINGDVLNGSVIQIWVSNYKGSTNKIINVNFENIPLDTYDLLEKNRESK